MGLLNEGRFSQRQNRFSTENCNPHEDRGSKGPGSNSKSQLLQPQPLQWLLSRELASSLGIPGLSVFGSMITTSLLKPLGLVVCSLSRSGLGRPSVADEFGHLRVAARSREVGRGHLDIETQRVSLAAGRLSVAEACELGAVHWYGYFGYGEFGRAAMLL